MAKRFIYLAVGALALTACTSEDVVEDVTASRNLIQFENVVNKPSRAADLTTNNLRQFNVFGFYTMPENASVANEVFDDVTVTRQDGGNWTYEVDDRYWVKDAKYYFYAYSCGSVTKLSSEYGKFSMNMAPGLTAADRSLMINDYLCDNTHQHDLIIASNTGATDTDAFAGILGKDKANDPVSFQFKHILSKVKARFTSKFSPEYEVVVKNVSIQNIRNVGTYNSASGWTKVERKAGEQPFVYLLNSGDVNVNPISFKNEKKADGTQAYGETQTAYVLPFGYSGNEDDKTFVYINFELDLYFGADKVLTKVLTGKFNPNWIEGYSYIYNVEVSGSTTGMDVITFTTAQDADGNVVTKWNEDETPKIQID
ncbi:MAG: fimbrillin family protein [Muribaculaceae bacterium]|nr:fimbrillin family protein [Muribaculaceae bacterium]